MADSKQRIIKSLEEFCKPGQFKRLTDSIRDRSQNYFAAIVSLAIALSSQQSAETGTGHIFQIAHVHNQFILATIVRGFKGLCKLRCSGAIYTAFDRDHIAMFKLLNR